MAFGTCFIFSFKDCTHFIRHMIRINGTNIFSLIIMEVYTVLNTWLSISRGTGGNPAFRLLVCCSTLPPHSSEREKERCERERKQGLLCFSSCS